MANNMLKVAKGAGKGGGLVGLGVALAYGLYKSVYTGNNPVPDHK